MSETRASSAFVRALRWCYAPRLGRLFQYPARPRRVPPWYRDAEPPSDAPTIAVVTPSFHQAAFLPRTCDSVLDQGYPRLEYAVQDGGSTDATPAVLDRYRHRLSSCVSAPDDGQAHAINLGFATTTGEIMAWLNSDDELLPGALATVATWFRAHPDVDVVYGHRVIVDEDGAEVGRWLLPRHDDRVLGLVDYVPQETMFWRRSLWERVGAGLDESFRFALDWELLLRFRAAGARFARIPRFLGAFRVHAAQKTSAEMATIGREEIERLQRRSAGRVFTQKQLEWRTAGYLLRHVALDRLYGLGLLRV